jgi:hypothetical protein
MAKLTFDMLQKEALGQLAQQTFNIANVEAKASKSGNVGYKVVTDQGKVITFWASTLTSCIEAVDDNGNFRVVPGTRLAEETLPDGTPALGLVPKDAAQGGFWK